MNIIRDLAITAVASFLLLLPLLGLRLSDTGTVLTVMPDGLLLMQGVAVALLLRGLYWLLKPQAAKLSIVFRLPTRTTGIILFIVAAIFPFLPFTDRYLLDIATLVLTYILLAWGLNITIGMTGLLDLGYVAFYAIGAYAYALLALNLGIGFWLALPVSMLVAMLASFIVGIPTLRLRGDYFAIATLGFAEIVRIIVTNWQSLTGGPNGLSRIPRPALFDLSFDRVPPDGMRGFAETFGLEFDAIHRVIMLYYIGLTMAMLLLLGIRWLRRLPLGRAMEAVREDEIAAASVGINVARVKIMAYALSSAIGALAGAFFAARQGFISPESFTFMETAVILAVVVLGGAGSMLGPVLGAAVLIGVPELFRDLQDYRMLAFGAGMVALMVWRPGGMFALRRPQARLAP